MPDDEYVDAMRDALAVAAARGVTCVHDKDGWLGAIRLWQRLHEQRALTLRVWQSIPHEHLDRVAEVGIRPGLGDGYLRVGYLKAFMDGTLGSQTARMLDGSGVEITSGDELAEIARRGAEAGLAGGRARDRRPREPRRARRLRAHEGALAAARAAGSGSSTRSASRSTICPASPQLGVAASVQFSHAPSDRDLAERFWPDELEGTYAFRSLIESGAVVANGSDAPIEELDPWAGIRAGVLRTLDDRPAWRPQEAVTLEQALDGDDHRARLAVRRRADARPPAPRLSRRPRRPRPRPVRLRAGGAGGGRGGRDDGRRPLGAQPSALGLRA